ncbi:MAG: selenocysteine-specific translation elongation factor [Pseudohongiellaceae bacterium]
MIIATAGHVDHGKTTLIRALTGTDTDRLAEEQRRGLTIDLGFAWWHDPQAGAIGFVDVPGHARFIRTMLAGIAGVDAALLVIAADEGPMPQTREHLALLDLLGVSRCIVVMTAMDRASDEQKTVCHAAIDELLQGSRLAGSPVIKVAAPVGAGMADLQAAIRGLAAGIAPRRTHGYPRFLIDRRFTVQGAGCVVTGTLLNGRLALDEQSADELCITPQGRPVRLRAMQVDGQPVNELQAGQRAALNLAGDLDSEHPGRGDWLLAKAVCQTSTRLDIHLRLLPGAETHRGTLQILAGASTSSGRLVWLDEAAGLAQVLPDRPVHAMAGDVIIVREPAANRTLGGGPVLDPMGRQRGRSRPEALARLAALSEVHSASVALPIELTHQYELNLPAFARRWNLRPDELDALMVQSGLIRLSDQGVSAARLAEVEARLLEAVQQAHAVQPEQQGVHQQQLLRSAATGLSMDTGLLLLKRLVADGHLQRHGSIMAVPGHQPVLPAEDRALWQRVRDELASAGLRPPIVGELAQRLGLEREAMLAFMQRMQQWGHVLAVAPNRFYLPERLDDLAAVARELCRESPDGSFSAAEYRDRSGIGRNLTIRVLEYLDRAGVTCYRRQRRFMQPGWQREPGEEIG